MSTVDPAKEVPDAGAADRQARLRVLARATRAQLDDAFTRLGGVPAYRLVKPPEIGAVMIEARAGGTGQRFNLGEATVTRCVVQVGEHLGLGMSLGRDRERAVLAAVADGMIENMVARDAAQAADLHRHFITPLADAHAARRLEQSRKAAATKVEFFTMVRGEG